MGALEYVPDRNYVDAADRSVDINALVQLASDILAERKSVHVNGSGQVMEQIIKVGTSAGGARAKAIIAWNETTNDIRSGRIEAGKGCFVVEECEGMRKGQWKLYQRKGLNRKVWHGRVGMERWIELWMEGLVVVSCGRKC